MATDTDGSECSCPLCPPDNPFTGSEGSVRAHIRATTSDEKHKGRSGFYTDLETGDRDMSIHDDPPGGHPSLFRDTDGDGEAADGGSDAILSVPDVEPAEAGSSGETAACPSCDEPLGVTEAEVADMADRRREANGIPRSEAVVVGECDACGNPVGHVHD